MTRRVLAVVARVVATGAATAAIVVVGAGPARADNCGSLADCFFGARGLLAALAAVLIVAGIVAMLFGGAAFLAGMFAGLGGGAGLGGFALAGGGVLTGAGAISAAAAAQIAGAGAIATAAGGVMMAQATGSSGGSSGGSGSSGGGGGSRPSSPNQMQQQAGRGQAPRSVDRVDNGRQLPNGRWEEPHVHFRDGSALYRDGVWRHGGRELTNAEIKWLTSNGWKVPGG